MEGILYLLQQLKGMVTPIGIFDIIDILIMAFIIYKLIMLIRRTSSGAVAKGILVLIVALWASSFANLNTVSFLLNLVVTYGAVALVVIFVLGTLVTSWIFPTQQEEPAGQEQTLRPTESELQLQQEQQEHNSGQEQVGTDGTVSYAGETYALSQAADGTWSLVNAAGDALIALEGTPVALIRTADTLLIPENRDGSWDVVSYVIGGHLDGITYVVGPDGNPAGGSGDIESVELDGTTLRVTAGGSTTDVALA